jgi:heme/copper-type cytochrome/quinol oxidase subunit 4
MDLVIEIFLEIFGELFIEIFINLIAYGISYFISFVVGDLDNNPNRRKKLKIAIYAICFIASIVLLVLSFIYSKTAYALLASIFLSINIGILGIRLINKTYFNKKAITVTTIILTRISRITFYVLMFIFLDTLKTDAAKITLISISSILMFIFACIDIYRIWKYRNNKKIEEKE